MTVTRRLSTAGRIALAGLLLASATGCSRLIAFNTFIPKDPSAKRVLRDVPFAPGPRGMLDVYVPAGRTKAVPVPVVVFFYGGSWKAGSRAGYGFVGRALAARGFATVIPDYRLMPEVRFPAFLEDNAAAVRWVRANARRFGGDPDRIVLVGHSAGAYDAAMLALDPQWLGADRKAVRGFAGLAGPYDFLPFDDPVAVQAFGSWARPEQTQPVHYTSSDDPPALIAWGERDERVRPANSIALAAGLRAANVEVEERRYPGVGHVGILTAIARPLRGRASVLDDVAAFAGRVSR